VKTVVGVGRPNQSQGSEWNIVNQSYKSNLKHKAPAKRSQHANATYRNVVGRNMLHAFGRRVATCRDILGVVGSSLKMVKFEPTTPNTLQLVAKRTKHVSPNNVAICCVDMLRSFGRA